MRIMSIPVLSVHDTPHLPETAVQNAVRSAFEQLAAGAAVQPAQTVTDLPGGGDVIAYQAVLAQAGVYAVKVSPYLPQDDAPPVITAWTLLLSLRTGQPLLLVDSAGLTAERTAATTALAVHHLAPEGAHRLAIVGMGPIGQAHLRHVRAAREFDEVTVFARDGLPPHLTGVTAAPTAEDAVRDADVVLLCTSAAEPVIDVRRLRPGVLVTSVSTNAPQAHEVDPSALAAMDVYADSTPAAFGAAGEMRIAAAEHGFTEADVRGDLAGLVTGNCPGPRGDRPVFFRSVGLGIEDAAVALSVLKEVGA